MWSNIGDFVACVVDVWSSRSARGSSVDSDKERDEVARAVLGLQVYRLLRLY